MERRGYQGKMKYGKYVILVVTCIVTAVCLFARKQHPAHRKFRGLAFIHVPKCGGTSLWDLLSSTALRAGYNAYTSGKHKPSWTQIPQSNRSATEVYGSNHINFFSLLRTWPGHEDAIFVTQLRHPVDRLVSHYYYARKNNIPLTPFAKNHTFAELLANVTDGYMISYFVDPNRYPWHITNGEVLTRCCFNRTHLEEAKELLRTKFAVVGILEEEEKTRAVLMCKVPWTLWNTTNDATLEQLMVTKHGVPDYDPVEMERKTELDLELYEYSRQLLNKQYEVCKRRKGETKLRGRVSFSNFLGPKNP